MQVQKHACWKLGIAVTAKILSNKSSESQKLSYFEPEEGLSVSWGWAIFNDLRLRLS